MKNSINGGRKKRELSELEDFSGEDETTDPLVQTAPVDYEELYDIMNQAYPLQIHSDDKRFLGEFKIIQKRIIFQMHAFCFVTSFKIIHFCRV